MPENPVLHGEYDTFRQDVERRLKGHDEMYEDVSDFKAALRELTNIMKNATNDIGDVMKDSRDPEGKCARCKAGIDKKIEDINRWRWKIIGAIGAFVAIPSIVSCIVLLWKLSEGGLK